LCNFDASKEFGIEVNAEKTKCVLLSCHQNAGQNYDIKIDNRSFENVAQLRYFGTTVTSQNLIQEEIKREFGQCLVPFSPECFVFSFAV
jgi:hypothetical protein